MSKPRIISSKSLKSLLFLGVVASCYSFTATRSLSPKIVEKNGFVTTHVVLHSSNDPLKNQEILKKMRFFGSLFSPLSRNTALTTAGGFASGAQSSNTLPLGTTSSTLKKLPKRDMIRNIALALVRGPSNVLEKSSKSAVSKKRKLSNGKSIRSLNRPALVVEEKVKSLEEAIAEEVQKLRAEARAKAEADAKAKEWAELKVREAEAAEAKAKAEAEAKAKAEAEAKAKAEAEAEAKAKEEAEAKAKEEAKAEEKSSAQAEVVTEVKVSRTKEFARKAKAKAGAIADKAKSKAEAFAEKTWLKSAVTTQEEDVVKASVVTTQEEVFLTANENEEHMENGNKPSRDYSEIESLEERAYLILVDLGMVVPTPDPDDPDYDSSRDDELAPENVFVNFKFES